MINAKLQHPEPDNPKPKTKKKFPRPKTPNTLNTKPQNHNPRQATKLRSQIRDNSKPGKNSPGKSFQKKKKRLGFLIFGLFVDFGFRHIVFETPKTRAK